MVAFDAARRAIHYPSDRRFRVWIKPSFIAVAACLMLLPLLVAWGQAAFLGLPHMPSIPQFNQSSPFGPHGFPLWVRYCHLDDADPQWSFYSFRSSAVYFNDGCTPGTEWVRFTPLKVPTDRVWTAKDDARYISPVFGLPGYRHTVGVARSWHFIDVYGFIATGVIFITLLLATEQWRRLVPTSSVVLTQAWSTFVDYANFHFPQEPNGFYGYNALQQLVYFTMVFVFGPLSILTGISMSPALVNRFAWFPRMFGGRQASRSIHFLLMTGYLAFIVAHVTLVALTGFARNMNHIVLGTDDQSRLGMILGFVGIAVVITSWIAAHYVSWNFPRMLQHIQKALSQPLRLATLNRLAPSQRYTKDQISPYFWPNGKMPEREDWKHLAATGFDDYKLKIGGLVEKSLELSISELEGLGKAEFITMHHCIQGWSGIARWTGVPMKNLIDLVRPKPSAKAVVFFSFGGSLYGGGYYDTQSLENVLKPECLLALEMNGAPLPAVYGAPLRLRVENRLVREICGRSRVRT